MIENEFWSLIESARLESRGDLKRLVELLQRTLETKPEQDIRDFDRLLHEQMRKSYTRDLWAAAYIINGGCSDDGFDYFRAWLVAQGNENFHAALHDPESLADVAHPDAELELLLYAAVKAFESKTNRRFPRPSHPAAELTGDEWEEDEQALQAKFPRLFARFWEAGAGRETASERGPLAPAADLLRDRIARDGTSVPEAEALYRKAVIEAMDETPESLARSAALLTQAADQGHAGAQYLLGISFQHGRGVPQSFSEAARLYRQAAENGNADACGALGTLYYQGLEIDQDFDEAVKWYTKGAELGSSDSEFGLGLLYSEGSGVERNLQDAFKWFHRAAQSGHEAAALNVGLSFLNGKGVEPDAARAFKWFLQAAEAGSLRARFNLGVLYEKGRGVERDIPKAAEMYQMAADNGYDGAMLNLGMLYSTGRGLAQDYARAAEWFRRAVDAGNLTALSNLATLYQHGRGVPQDLGEAIRLYRKSAEAGVAVGQFNLGTMYHRGIGVPKDDQEAMRWYRLAAAQNLGSALNNIADAYENGYGAPQDYAEAAKWCRQAADRGVSVSHYSLGKLYRDGRGVARDYQEAEKWLTAAVEKGVEKARADLEALYEAGHVKRPRPETSHPASVPPAAKSQGDADRILVSPQSAAQRALCLRALIRRLEIEVMLRGAARDSEAAERLNLDGLKVEAAQIEGWLKDEGLWMETSDTEKKLLKSSPGAWPEAALKNASWRAEALGVIGWALGLEDRIAPYDSQLDKSSFVYSLKIPSPTRQFISGATLRAEKEILDAREIAENWLWRARTTQIQKEPEKYPAPAGWTYERIIAAAAEHWEKEGLFNPVKGDYPALGKAYCELTDEEWQTMRSIATERLYGLNWLCKFSADWDRVPTGT